MSHMRQLVRWSRRGTGCTEWQHIFQGDFIFVCTCVCCCSTESSKKKPPIYKVMLHNDNYNRREYVVKILLRTVEGLTVDDAVNVMQVRAIVNSSSSSTHQIVVLWLGHVPVMLA